MDKTAFFASRHSFYNIPSIIQHTGEITGVLSLVLLINDTGVLGIKFVMCRCALKCEMRGWA